MYFCTDMMHFIKNWTLPLAMITGALGYFAYASIPALDSTHQLANHVIAIVQPLLLFAMLFLTFCKVRPSDLRLAAWQGWVLLFQTAFFLIGALLIYLMANSHWTIVIEGGMLCMICPTATAAAVVTRKLGGQAGTLMAYTIIINLTVAILIPIVVPIIHPCPDLSFVHAFLLIISKVFPLLLGPLFLSMLMRWLWPRSTEWLSQVRDLPFYLWAVSLSLAIAVSTKSIVHSHIPWGYQAGIAIISLIACIMQFAFGRRMGNQYDDPISAAQACGQKNTVFAIWLGYTFLTPVTSIAGGFYSIWHNVWNSYQLYKLRKTKSSD